MDESKVDALMELETREEVVAAVRSLPMGKMPQYDEASKRFGATKKVVKKAAPKKKAAKKAKKED